MIEKVVETRKVQWGIEITKMEIGNFSIGSIIYRIYECYDYKVAEDHSYKAVKTNYYTEERESGFDIVRINPSDVYGLSRWQITLKVIKDVIGCRR